MLESLPLDGLMDLDLLPLFDRLTPAHRLDLNARAERRRVSAGDVLFYPGDPANTLIALVEGTCQAGTAPVSIVPITAPALLDAAAALGGLPHRVKVVAGADCTLLRWPMERLWADSVFRDVARRWLAESLCAAQDRVAALDAPRVFDERAGLPPGPFMFEDATIIFTFCEANLDALRSTLPEGLRVFRRVGRSRDALLLAFAEFPRAFPEHDPAARFGYTETTVFVPARCGVRMGLTVPYIYPSTYDPILLGREIYGFPKQLAQTTLAGHEAALVVGGAHHATLRWGTMLPSDDVRLVRALMDWLGLEGWTLARAYQAGDMLLKAMRYPPFRSVSVYNHKRILDASASAAKPVYALDQLTHAVFGVQQWYQVTRLDAPALTVSAGPLAGWDVTIREAYRAQLDMRLSRGSVVRDYRAAVKAPPRDE